MQNITIVEKHDRYIVEEVFDYKDFKCAITFNHLGFRCGYVGVPKTNELYGLSYDQANEFADCHGGLTYSSEIENLNYPIKSDLWWFGFDCGHCDDTNDLKQAAKYFPHLSQQFAIMMQAERMFPTGGEIRDREYVKENCVSLAESFIEYIRQHQNENER